MEPLALVKLTELMDRTSGRPDVRVGLIDGPVQAHHPELEGARVERPSDGGAACTASNGFACLHGTFITGILVARRGSTAPGICPECTVVLRPIFGRSPQGPGHTPTATPSELATAILECLDAGVRLINLSLALTTRTSSGDRALEDALTRAAGLGVRQKVSNLSTFAPDVLPQPTTFSAISTVGILMTHSLVAFNRLKE